MPAPKLDQTLIIHLRVVTSLVEARPVSLADVLCMVKEILRQHSFDKRGNRVYEVLYSENLPP
jgi:hypothetical protein